MSFSDEELPNSSGAVVRPDSYCHRSHLPIEGGLYGCDIFGTFPAPASPMSISEDPRRDCWGHIDLGFVARWGDALVRRVPVIPPFYRRFRVLAVQEARSDLRIRRAEALAKYVGPQRQFLVEQGLWSETADAPLSNDDIDALDLPTQLREPPLNFAYRTVVTSVERLKYLINLGATTELSAELRQLLNIHLDELRRRIRSVDLPTSVRTLALGRLAHGYAEQRQPGPRSRTNELRCATPMGPRR